MSTGFVDDRVSTDVGGVRETALEALPVTTSGAERDALRLRVAQWREADEGSCTVMIPGPVSQDTLSTQLSKLHGALTFRTQATVIVRFFDSALTDTMDAVFSARARSEESWLVDQGRFSRTQAPSRAWRTFEELSRWLGIGKVRTAKVLAISRGTTNAWKAGREPQPSNARRLYRTHAIVKTLVRRLGLEETRTWMETGEPAPLDLLAAGDFAAVDRAASALVFDGGARESERVGAFVPDTAETGRAVDLTQTDAPRRIQRRGPRPRAR